MSERPPLPPQDDDAFELELDAVRGALFEQIERERGLRARVRELPTSVRRAALVAWTLGLMALAWPGWGMWTLLFGASALALGWLSLRPMHRPPLPRAVEIGVLGVALGGAVVVSLIGHGPAVGMSMHLRCFVPGIVVAASILAGWWLLSRRDLGFYAIAGAACAGMGANAFLSARCPSTNPEHLFLAHLSVLALAVLAGWATTTLRRA